MAEFVRDDRREELIRGSDMVKHAPGGYTQYLLAALDAARAETAAAQEQVETWRIAAHQAHMQGKEDASQWREELYAELTAAESHRDALAAQVVELTAERNRIARECADAHDRNIDLREQLAHPVPATPPSLKPRALYQAIIHYWFRRDDGSAPDVSNEPAYEMSGFMQPTLEETQAFVCASLASHWNGECGCQGVEVAPPRMEII